MPYQYVREPLTAQESDRLSNACETPTERLVVWTLLDTGLRVGELCDHTRKNVLRQQRQLRFKGKGGPHGKKTKVRVVPMSSRVRALLEHHFALGKAFPVKTRRAQDIVKAVANRAGITEDVSPHVLRHTLATTASRRRPSTSTSLTFTSRTSSSGNGENGPSAGCPANWTAFVVFCSVATGTRGHDDDRGVRGDRESGRSQSRSTAWPGCSPGRPG